MTGTSTNRSTQHIVHNFTRIDAQSSSSAIGASNSNDAVGVSNSNSATGVSNRNSIVGASLDITLQGDKATARFKQHYKSANLKSSAAKTLILVHQNGRWLIKEERVN